MPDIDAAFLAMPLRGLAGSGPGTRAGTRRRARDVRLERMAGDAELRDARLEGAGTPRRSGSRCGSSTTGVGVRERPRSPRGRGCAGRAGGRRARFVGVLRARLRTGSRRSTTRRLGLVLRDRPVRRSRRRAHRAADRAVRTAARRRRRRPRRRVLHPGAGEQVLRRHRGHDDHPAARPPPPGVHRDRRRPRRGRLLLDAHPRAAGRPRLGVPHRHRLGLRRRDRAAARPVARAREGAQRRAGPLRPGHRPVQPLADDPRVVGHATELDRALGYEAAYAGTSFATLDSSARSGTAAA